MKYDNDSNTGDADFMSYESITENGRQEPSLSPRPGAPAIGLGEIRLGVLQLLQLLDEPLK